AEAPLPPVEVPEVTPPAVTPPVVERAPSFYVGLAAVSELNDRVPARFVVGTDRLLGPIGFRATVDYGRQSPIDQGTLAFAGHLTYRFDLDRIGAYVGAGAGYQLDLMNWGQANDGLFAGGLL